MPTLSEDLAFRGLIHQVTDPADELMRRLDQGGLTVYAGFDPTADSLHLGSLIPMITLRRFQLAGHRPISLAGGGTGMIGDPGGKSEERNLLTPEILESYLEGIRPQMGLVLDLTPGASTSGGTTFDTSALLLDNSVWLTALSTIDFLRDVGKHFTVNQMVAKDSVKSRFDRPDQGISYTEFSYMLLQAYDYLHLHTTYGCDLQLGGSDQWGNIVTGVDYIRRVTGHEVWGLTTPLLLKPDGTKYGKTGTGTLWLDPKRTSPFAIYQFLYNSDDDTVGALLRYYTFLEQAEITALDLETAEHPRRRAAQKALARAVVSLVHGDGEVARCEEASAALFTEDIAGLSEDLLLAVTEDAPSTDVARSELSAGLSLVDALERTGLESSRSKAMRTIEQGGANVNNVRQSDVDRTLTTADLLHDRYLVLRKGKRDVHVIRAT